MARNSEALILSWLLVLAVIFVQPLLAEEETQDQPDPQFKSTLADKFEVHGYLSLGYAASDGHQVLGIPDDGTSDYSNAAFQVRFAPSDKDEFFVQFSREHLGQSPSNVLRKDSELDWLFYRRRFNDATAVAVGRVPIPVGIYNKIKDVGTLLPFFRPSPSVYGDGTWTSDTVDGLILSHKFARQSPWGLDADLYYGDWERLEGDTFAYEKAQVEDAVGVQLWLRTPLRGVRFGVGANRSDASGGIFLPPGVEVRDEVLYVSFDSNFDPVVFRTEYAETKHAGGYWRGHYAELLVQATERLKVVTRYDTGRLKVVIPFFAEFEEEMWHDFALGLNYAFRSNLVLKLEHHWHEGYDIESQRVNLFFSEPLSVNYGILSLAVHF